MLVLTGCPSDDDGNRGGDGGGGAGEQDSGQSVDGDGGVTDASSVLDGNLHASDSGSDAGCASCGDGSVTTGERPFPGNGISAKVDGSAITYTNVMLYPNNSGTGLLHLEATSTDFLSKWRIFVPSTPGTYECVESGTGTLLQLISATDPSVGGVGSGLGSCSITLAANADGVLHGTFQGSLLGGSGGMKAVSEGVFYYSMYGGGTGGDGLGANEQGASFKVDGQRYTYKRAAQLAFEGYAGMGAQPAETTSPGFPLGVQLHTVPNMTGTYACGDGPAYRNVNVWFYWKGAFYMAGARQSATPQGPAGSSCSITVTTVGTVDGSVYSGTLAGSFSGTFVKADGSASVVVTDGSFRLIVP